MKKTTKPVTPKIRVLIIDEHPLIARGLREILAADLRIEVVDSVSNSEALLYVGQHKPDVAVLDLSIKGMQGMDTLKQIAYDPRTKVVVIDLNNEPGYATRAIKGGAKAYLTQSIEATLTDAVRQVVAGRLCVSNDVAQLMVATLAKASVSRSVDPIDALSDRELHLAELMVQGLSASQIAETMEISIKTVETHKAHIKAKLGISTGAQLVRYCVEWYSQRHAERRLTPAVR